MMATSYQQRREDAAREKQAREAALAAAGEAGQSIEARLGIVKKNRRSNSGIPGGLESVDLTKDDSTESRRRIAEYIGRFGLHRSASEGLRREGRASTPDGSGRRAKSQSDRLSSVEGLQVYEMGDGIQTLPARLRDTGSAAGPAEGSKAFGSHELLCPAAVELPEQMNPSLALLGFNADCSPSEVDMLQPLLDALVGESLSDPCDNPLSLWSALA